MASLNTSQIARTSIPPDFLRTTPTDAQPIAAAKINFAASELPEYTPHYATVLENVLSASECAELLALALENAPNGKWEPVPSVMVRLRERIVWDSPVLAARIWDRCLQAPGVKDELGQRSASRGDEWEFSRLNEQMRFFRSGPGHDLKLLVDGTHVTPSGGEASFYMLLLYLSDSAAGTGGAMRFVSGDILRSLAVDAKMGRVLIFQHSGLLRSEQEVLSGVKVTMRTDLMYRRSVVEC